LKTKGILFSGIKNERTLFVPEEIAFAPSTIFNTPLNTLE
jgi:hypothetical protein